MLLENPGCCVPSPSPPSSCAAISILDGVRKDWASLPAPCPAGEAAHSLTHSHFPMWQKQLQAKKFSLGTELCYLEGEVMQVKWNCFSCLLQCIQSQIAFVPTMCWNFSAGLQDFPEDTLIVDWLSKLVFFGGKWWKNCIHFDDFPLFTSPNIHFCQTIQSMWVKASGSETLVS